MRQVGMKAYQTVLFPYLTPAEVQRMNHLETAALSAQNLDIDREIERALTVTEPLIARTDHDIHLVGDILTVMLNLRQWNGVAFSQWRAPHADVVTLHPAGTVFLVSPGWFR
jgi:hypothetical protein